jgi:hypothetical protein
MIQKEPYKFKNSLGDTLGNLVGSEGVKVAIKLAPETIPVLILSIIGAVIIGGLAKDALSRAIIK